MNFNGKSLGYAMITPAQIGAAVGEYLAANPNNVTAVDFSNVDNGIVTETFASGEVITHAVEFDASGRLTKFDNVTINWGNP